MVAAKAGRDHDPLADLLDRGLLMSIETSSLSIASASLLMLVRVEEAGKPPDLFFPKPAIFRRPRLIEEFFFASLSETRERISGLGGERSETREERVAGRCSLEAHEVGAVD